MDGYVHYVINCQNGHGIPIPRPSQAGIDGSLQATATNPKRVVLVCPDCGIVSAYSGQDVRDFLAPTHDPFLTDECRLFEREAGCDGSNCEAPKVIHTVESGGAQTWKPKAAAIRWSFAESARCPDNHQLYFDESLHVRKSPKAELF
ncbi:MAG TPA: hypothetical protein VK763_05195 [Terriglobales bacterium]|jgi:hypothetical protein|nr:hypothetical protein [Terriglobales bacterium]